jgi:hypothetical protein
MTATLILILKLTLVPTFLAIISLVGKRYGPSAAGWLAGLPVIVGPILFLLSLEHGPAFAANAAVFTLASVLTLIAFGLGYAWMASRGAAVALASALGAWLVAALIVRAIPFTPMTAAIAAYGILLIGGKLYPRVAPITGSSPLPTSELLLRMAAGAGLTLFVTAIADNVGEAWSGIAALAPLLTPILAVFIHVRSGADHVVAMLRSLVRGVFALATFCFVLSLVLPTLGIPMGFALAIVSALAVHTVTFFMLRAQLRRHAHEATST